MTTEPTGLGAVIRDANGDLYVHPDNFYSPRWRKCGTATTRHTWWPWDFIPQPVEILSEGVQI